MLSGPDSAFCTEECAACLDGPPVECSECAGDLDDDGDVGVPDLLALLGCWGDLASGCECADLDGSGSVGVSDLLELLAQWGQCAEPPTSCCEEQPPGEVCNDAECYDFICGYDPFCCTVWDEICAEFAEEFCDVCGGTPPPPSTCCSAHPGVGCDDRTCESFICEFQPWCCESQWNSSCVQFAIAYCTECGGTPTGCGARDAGNCCVGGGTPFCDDEACCECVCELDPFCCNTVWDSLCGASANDTCTASCPCDP